MAQKQLFCLSKTSQKKFILLPQLKLRNQNEKNSISYCNRIFCPIV